MASCLSPLRSLSVLQPRPPQLHPKGQGGTYHCTSAGFSSLDHRGQCRAVANPPPSLLNNGPSRITPNTECNLSCQLYYQQNQGTKRPCTAFQAPMTPLTSYCGHVTKTSQVLITGSFSASSRSPNFNESPFRAKHASSKMEEMTADDVINTNMARNVFPSMPSGAGMVAAAQTGVTDERTVEGKNKTV
ncbi:hypothetical protein Bbelb_238910 [Branchiostoma belcheri]|nr:hypothetical protein Bbelb_238910 [Branchiostoma belcheri]